MSVWEKVFLFIPTCPLPSPNLNWITLSQTRLVKLGEAWYLSHKPTYMYGTRNTFQVNFTKTFLNRAKSKPQHSNHLGRMKLLRKRTASLATYMNMCISKSWIDTGTGPRRRPLNGLKSFNKTLENRMSCLNNRTLTSTTQTEEKKTTERGVANVQG